jgi:hypothetical protein
VAKAPAAAHDIKLEVAGVDRRVEVRLVERGGEVHMAVRTPDDRLAETLRAHLPQLSSRLEQSGFRADGWHAAGAGATERRLDVESAATGSGDTRDEGRQPGGGREQPDDQPRRPRDTEESAAHPEKGTSFQWLFNSLP